MTAWSPAELVSWLVDLNLQATLLSAPVKLFAWEKKQKHQLIAWSQLNAISHVNMEFKRIRMRKKEYVRK